MAIIVALVAVCVSTPARAQKGRDKPGDKTGYSVIELDTLPGTAYRVNGQAEIVGEAGDQARYWLYDPASQDVLQIPLPDPEGIVFDESRATDINDNGLIVGVGWADNGQGLEGTPLLWVDSMSDPFVLPLPEGFTNGGATAINNAGLVVGVAGLEGCAAAIAWRVFAGGLVEGPVVLATGDNASAQDINENGLAVGWVNDHAIRWTLSWDGELVLSATDELFDPSLVPYSHAQGVNDAGDVCGQAELFGFTEAFLLQNGGLVPLKPLVDSRKAATVNVNATALNNATSDHGVQVVGSAYVYDRATYVIQYDAVTLWEEDQTVTNLTAEGSRKTKPSLVRAINDSGWVTGATFNTNLEQNVPMLMIPD
jgi:uncharacterized membrane protein